MENRRDVTGEGGVLVDPPPPPEWQPGLKMGNTPSLPEGTGKGDQTASQDSDSGTDLSEDAANSPVPPDEEKISDGSASVSVATAEESSPPGPAKLESSEPPPARTDPDSPETTSAVRTTPDGSDQTETESPSPEAPEKDSTTPGDTSTPDPSNTAADEPEAVTDEDKVEFSEVVEKKAEDKAPAATTEDTTTDPQTATDAAEESSASAPSTTTSTATMSTEARTASYFQAAGMDPGMVQLLKQMYPDIFVQMEAYTRLVSHVNTLGFSFRSHVPMDGNCMFHAVADQLRRTEGPEMSHQELRSKTVDHLRKHPFTEGNQHLRSFVPDEKWDSYLTAMSRDGEWGDHIALIALASVLRREIHVVSSTPGDDFLTKVHPNGGTDEPVTGPPLLLGHYAEQHYVSLDGPQRPRRQLSRQLSIEAPPPRDLQDKPEGMTFHGVCGPTIMLSPNKRSAHRLSVPDEQTSTSALVFSASPVQVDQEVQIEFSGYTDKGSGALYFGVTTVDPATWSPAELPATLAVDERNMAGFWVWPIDHDLMTTGALFKFSVNCNGNLEYSSNVNGGRSKLQLASIPADQPIWAVLDLQGRTQTVKFVDGEDKKKATVIWKKGEGPDFPPDINVVMGFLQNLLMDKIQILKSCAAVIREEETPERARRALTYLRKLTMNVIETGDEEENRKVYIGNSEFKETILRAHSAQQFMVAAGWCQVDDMMVFTRTCDVLLQPTVEALDESLNALPEESFTENDTTEETQPAEEKNALQDRIQIISTCAAIIKEQERTKLAREALNTVRRMTNNILKQPDDQKYRKVRVGNKTFQETVMKSTNAQQFVVAAGWKQVEDVMVFDKSNDELLSPTLQIIDELLSSLPWETPDDNDETAHPFVPQSTAEASPVGSSKLVKGLPTGVKATRDVRFHVIRGSNIALSPDRKSARRKGGISNAITFSDNPFGTGQMIAVQITDRDSTVECAVVLGVTTVDPIKWDTEQLPQFLSNLSSDDGFWSEPVGDDAALPGNILTLHVSGSGSMKCSVYATGSDRPVEEFDVVCNIPTGKPMWAVLDLFGSTTAVSFVDIEEKQDSDEDAPLVTETDRSYVASLLSNISENIPSTTDKEGESKKANEASGDSSPTRTSGPAEEEIKDAEASAHATGETAAAEAGMSTEDLPRENWLTPFVNELLEKETVEQAKLTLTTLWTITDQVSSQKASDDNTRKLTTNDIPFAEAIKATPTTYQLFQKAGWKTLGDMLVFPQFGGHGPILVALEEGLCNLDKDETPAPEEKTDTSEGPHSTVKLTMKSCIEMIEGKETTGQARITLSAIRDVARRVRDNPGDNKYRKIDMRERAYADAIRRSEAAKNFMVTAGWIQVGDKLIFPKYCDKRLDRILTTVEESLSKLPDFHLAPEDGETAKEEKEPKETKSPPEEKEKAEEKITEGKIASEVKKHPEEETPVAAPGSNTRAPVNTVGTKRQRLAFCSIHGSALQLRDGGKTMRRLYATDDDTSAITFSNRPIDIGEKITVEITEYRSRYSEDGRGVVILGLTTEDPSTLSQIDLPACVIDLTVQKNYWARRIKGKYVGSGDTLTFYLDKDGNLTYSLKDVEDEVHLCDIPTDKPLWAILDMDGGATTLTFKDDRPEEKGFRMPWEGWSIEPDITTSPAAETDKLRDGTPQTTEQNTEEEATPARSPVSPSEPDVDAEAMTEEEKLAFAFQKFKEQVKDPAKEQPPEELIRLINAIRQRSEDGDDSSDSEDEDDEFNLSSELLGKLGSAFFETIMRSELQHLFGQSTSTSEEASTGSGAGEPRHGLAETKASLEDRVQIVKACIETMEEEAGTERAIMSLTLIRQMISNILDHPGDPKYRQIRMKNKSVSGDILDVPTAVQLLAAIGWVQSDNSFVLPSSSDDLLEPTLKAVDESLRKLNGEETPTETSEEAHSQTAEEEATVDIDTAHQEAATWSTEEVEATETEVEPETDTAREEEATERSEEVTTTMPGEDMATDSADRPMEEPQASEEPKTGLDVLRSKAAELLQDETPQQAWLILTVLEKMLRDVVKNPKDEASRHVRHLLPPSALKLLVAAGCVQVENMIIFPTEIKLLQDALEVVMECQGTLTETESEVREEPGMFVAGAVQKEEGVKQEANQVPQGANAATEAMCFNSVHGKAVLLTKDRSVARLLLDSPGSGIVFSDRPAVVDEKVSIELTEYWYDRKGSKKGDLVLGVTTVDPFVLDSDDLPPSTIPHLTNKPGYWAMRIRRQRIVPGDVLTVFVDKLGNLWYSVNEEVWRVLICDLPTDTPLWVLMDMDGGVTAVTFVRKDDKGSEQSSSQADVEKEEKLEAASFDVDSDLYDPMADVPLPETHMTPQDEQPSEAASASLDEDRSDEPPEKEEVDLNSMTKEERMDFIMKMQGEEFSLEEKTGLLKVCVDVIKEDETPEQAKTSLKYLVNRMSNLWTSPEDERYRQVYIRSGTFWEAMRPRSAQQFMVAAGWVQVGDNMVFPNYYDALIKPALDVLNECLSSFPPEPISLYGRKDPVGDAERVPETTTVKDMAFNEVHGSAIELSGDGRTATHTDNSTDTSSTITFGAKQINANEEVLVKMSEPTDDDAIGGTFSVGITTLDPSTLKLDDLPKQAADLKSSDGFWIWPLDDSLTDGGSVLKLSVSCTGNLTYCVDDKPPGGFISNIPTDQPLWVILVLQGRVREVTFVDEDEKVAAETDADEAETSGYPWGTEEDDLYDLPSYGSDPTNNGAGLNGGHSSKKSPEEIEALLRDKVPILDACADAIKAEASADRTRFTLSYIRMQTRKILNRPSSDETRVIHVKDKMFLVAASSATQTVMQFMVAAGWVIRDEQKTLVFPRSNDDLLEPTIKSLDSCLRTIPGGYLDVSRLEDQIEGMTGGIEELQGVEFHTVHGANIELSEDKRTARRPGDISKALVFSSKPFRVNKRVTVEFTDCEPDTKCAAMFGVTTENPLFWKPADLPLFGTDLAKRDGYWLEPLGEDVATEGSALSFHVDGGGSLVYSLCGTDGEETMKDVEVFNDIPTDKPLWAVLDLFGSTKAVKFVDKEVADDESEPEIDTTFQLPGSGFQSSMGSDFQLPTGTSFQPPKGTSFQPPMGTSFNYQQPMSDGDQSPIDSDPEPFNFKPTTYTGFTPPDESEFLDLD